MVSKAQNIFLKGKLPKGTKNGEVIKSQAYITRYQKSRQQIQPMEGSAAQGKKPKP